MCFHKKKIRASDTLGHDYCSRWTPELWFVAKCSAAFQAAWSCLSKWVTQSGSSIKCCGSVCPTAALLSDRLLSLLISPRWKTFNDPSKDHSDSSHKQRTDSLPVLAMEMLFSPTLLVYGRWKCNHEKGESQLRWDLEGSRSAVLLWSPSMYMALTKEGSLLQPPREYTQAGFSTAWEQAESWTVDDSLLTIIGTETGWSLDNNARVSVPAQFPLDWVREKDVHTRSSNIWASTYRKWGLLMLVLSFPGLDQLNKIRLCSQCFSACTVRGPQESLWWRAEKENSKPIFKLKRKNKLMRIFMDMIKRNSDYLLFLEKVNLKCVQAPLYSTIFFFLNLQGGDTSLVVEMTVGPSWLLRKRSCPVIRGRENSRDRLTLF